MKRDDIKLSDVFISWTGTDEALKATIASALREAGIVPLLSDENCQGDFEEWSREAATSAHVFMPIITRASLTSVGMHWEIEAYGDKLLSEDGQYFREAFLPVSESLEIYQQYLSLFPEKAREKLSQISTVVLMRGENGAVSRDTLDDIVRKTAERLSSGFFRLYTQKSTPKYIKLLPLYAARKKDRNYRFDELYIPRTVIRIVDGALGDVLDTPKLLHSPGSISFIAGKAGSGKTQYINEIKKERCEDTIVIAFSCTELSESALSLFDEMYREFHRICSQRIFFTEDNFRRLLDTKRLTVVFDGMDEITTVDEKRRLIKKIEAFYLANPTTALIFTGRDENDADLVAIGKSAITRYRLNDLDRENVQKLSHNLFSLLSSDAEIDPFLDKLFSLNENIRSSPLLITQLALVYHEAGKLPETELGILDAVSEITLKNDRSQHTLSVPSQYLPMIERGITSILKDYSRETYVRMTEGAKIGYTKILNRVLKKKYNEDKDELSERCRYLVDYFETRGIMEEGRFFHKSFLEYFTALSYIDNALDSDYGEIEDESLVTELFSHYQNPYWEKVIGMFLIKADEILEKDAMLSLCELLLSLDISDHSLLLSVAQSFSNHRTAIETRVMKDILLRSVNGEYHPYGALFYYVPTYHLYRALLAALSELPADGKTLSLVRDVAVITGGYACAREIDPTRRFEALFDRVKERLDGTRYLLAEIFYTDRAVSIAKAEIYPRCFDPYEALSFKEHGHGAFTRNLTPFDDELGLFSHGQFPEQNGQYLGFVSTLYNKDAIEKKLNSKKHDRVTALALTPSGEITVDYMHFVRSNVKAFFVPETTVSFGEDAFLYMDLNSRVRVIQHTLVYLPNDVKSVTVPDTVAVITSAAFEDLTALKTVNLPDSIVRIEKNAFQNCSSLTDIHLPDSLKEIGDSAFSSCSSLTEITLPKGITKLGSSLFFDCSSLKRAIVDASITALPDFTFAACPSLTDARLNSSLKSINAMAFTGCSSLTRIDLSENLETIGWFAFSSCDLLTELYLPDSVSEIGMSAFDGCKSLKKVRFSRSLSRVKEKAFEECTALEEICLPDSLTELGDYAFKSCTALKSISLPPKITFLNSTVFEGCASIRQVYMSEKQWRISNLFSVDTEFFDRSTYEKLTLFRESSSLVASGIQGVILPHTYQNRAIRSVVISKTVLTVGVSAFEDCSQLDEVLFPDTLKEIGSAAFKNCRALRTLTLPLSLRSIDHSAFEGCSSLVGIELPDSVTALSDHVFCGCSALEQVRLPQKLSQICGSLFENCSSLKAIELNASTDEIGPFAFKGCSSLIKIELPNGLIRVGLAAFEDCTSLTNISLPDSVEDLADAVFSGCSSLKTARLPQALSRINRMLFQNCTALSEIVLPDTVSEIGFSAFRNCTSLSRITLPDTLTEIESLAFQNCTSLTELIIPPSVRLIGNSAFKDCTSLTSVTLSANFKNDIERIFGKIDPAILHFTR